jgi:hypothetical protein
VNYKAMLSPQTEGTGGIRVVVTGAWSAPPENFREMQFWHSQTEFRPRIRDIRRQVHLNWNAVLGLVITTGFSAAFWVALGLTVAHIWK